MKFDFKNKKILVTGSSRGLGKAIADSFFMEGAYVCYSSRNISSTQFAKDLAIDNKKVCFDCDFTDNIDIHKLKENIERIWGGVDVLVCNVGSGKSLPDPITDKQHFSSVFNLNCNSAIDTTREFLPLLEKSRGCILYISSICGIESIFGAPTDYSVSKAALQAFAKNLARKIADKGVRVNCVAPGNILFPGGSWEKKLNDDPKKTLLLITSTVPMQKFGTLEDISNACLFLCSEQASFITGSTLVVDGGQTLSM